MRVALVYNDYESVSGETVFFNNMCRGLETKGFDIERFAIKQSRPHTFLGSFEHYSRFPLLLKTADALRGKKFDVIHFLNAALAPAASSVKGKVIATSHFFLDSYIKNSPNPNPAMRIAESVYADYVSLLDRSSFNSLDRLVACTDYQASCIKERYGLPDPKISVIPPGADAGYLRSLPEIDLCSEYGFGRVIVSMGRLHERSKGISYLIRAMKLVDDAGLLIIGDGPDRGYYEKLVRDEGLQDRIRFLGTLDFRTKSIIQKSADTVAIPSLYEVFALIFAESLACDVPVVAFDLPFWKGVYDEAAIFARPRDPVSLAESLERAMKDDPKIRARRRELSDRYDLKRTIDSYISLYQSL